MSRAGAGLADASHADGGLVIQGLAREVLAEEVERFGSALAGRAPENDAGSCRALAAAFETGEVPLGLLGALERFLEVVLESGALRHRHGPGAERAVLDLFYRTPRGLGLRRAAEETNRALRALAGQRLERLSFHPALPGGYRLHIESERCELRLEIDRHGVRARDVALAV